MTISPNIAIRTILVMTALAALAACAGKPPEAQQSQQLQTYDCETTGSHLSSRSCGDTDQTRNRLGSGNSLDGRPGQPVRGGS